MKSIEDMEKQWKENTKMSRIEKINIGLSVVMVLLNIVNAIIYKNLLYILIAVLWLVIGFTDYSNAKIYRSQKYLIEQQDNWIKELLKEIKEINNG